MENPFSSLKIDDWSFLLSRERHCCPSCRKSRMYLCYTCNIPVCDLSKTPSLKVGADTFSRKSNGLSIQLPCHFDIIKHPREYMGKSTSPQAVVLAPEDCILLTYPEMPQYDPDKVSLIFCFIFIGCKMLELLFASTDLGIVLCTQSYIVLLDRPGHLFTLS